MPVNPHVKYTGDIARKRNVWIEHVAKFRQLHPELSYKQVLIEAKKTYTKK